MKRKVIDYMAKDKSGNIISPLFQRKTDYQNWLKEHRDGRNLKLDDGTILTDWVNYQSELAPLRINL